VRINMECISISISICVYVLERDVTFCCCLFVCIFPDRVSPTVSGTVSVIGRCSAE
jgi:hypothetical protein